MGSNINEAQNGISLRESVSFEPSCAKIRRRVWPIDEFPKNGINKNNLGYISAIRPQAPRVDVHQIWHSCRSHGLNHLWQILWRSVKGCRFSRGPKIAISHWLSQSPLTLGWCYRAARDAFTWTSFSFTTFSVFFVIFSTFNLIVVS